MRKRDLFFIIRMHLFDKSHDYRLGNMFSQFYECIFVSVFTMHQSVTISFFITCLHIALIKTSGKITRWNKNYKIIQVFILRQLHVAMLRDSRIAEFFFETNLFADLFFFRRYDHLLG